MTRKAYDTDLNDQEWAKIEPYFSKHRTYKWPKRVLVNETLYVTKTGCQWRMLPHDFPLYLTVWSFFRRSMTTGWFQVNGRWYYADSSGALAVNTTVDGYSVNYNGEWVQ